LPYRPTPAGGRRERLAELALTLAVLLTSFAFYSLLASRERPWTDARIMYEVAERMVTDHRIDIRTEWPPMSHRGREGRVYSIYGLFPSLVSVPGVIIREAVKKRHPEAAGFALVVTCHLAHSLLGALTCMVFFRAARRLRASVAAASVATVVLGAATMLMIYARVPLSEVLQALCFTGFIAQLVFVPGQPTRRGAMALGAWAGALLNTKLIFVLALGVGGLYLVFALWRDRAALIKVLGFAALAFLPFLALAGAYNRARWGSPLITGYEAVESSATESVLLGLFGFVFSLGKSVFIFSPPLVMAAFAAVLFARHHPRAALGAALVSGTVVLAYARFTFWAGDWCWGPRYLTFLVPTAMLPLAPALDHWWAGPRRRWVTAVLALVATLGMAVQLLGSMFFWDHHIRITRAVQTAWLGNPNRAGAALLNLGGPGVCAACFEDMYGWDWLPPFQPVEGHLWLARHLAAKHNWRQAAADAPWRRYTRLPVVFAGEYGRARFDWWALLWMVDDTRMRPRGRQLLALFGGMLLLGSASWIAAGLVHARRAPSPMGGSRFKAGYLPASTGSAPLGGTRYGG
jgi:hypothetical protein